MKKIILTVVFVALSTMSAKAVDFSVFSLTGGLATNSSVFGASGKEENFSDTTGNASTLNTDEGVFTESYGSQFVELGVGKYISLGYEHTPDSISSPQNVANEGDAVDEQTVSVDFNDKNTKYIKFNVPGGIYVKLGDVDVDVDIKTSRGTYADRTTSGTSVGLGYQRLFGESGFGLRVEGNYLDFDNVTSNDGDTTDTVANSGRTVVTAKNLEALEAKLAITYTFGRNN